jgi:hypothetical protein
MKKLRYAIIAALLIIPLAVNADVHFTGGGGGAATVIRQALTGSNLGPGVETVYVDVRDVRRIDFSVEQLAPGGSVSFKVYASLSDSETGAAAVYDDVSNIAYGSTSFPTATKILLDTSDALVNASWIKFEFTYVTTSTGSYTIRVASESGGAS